MPSKSCQDGGIVFGGRWKLFPVDERNWELCHLHETRDTNRAVAAGTAGKLRWNRLGRFYSYNALHLAIQYAADEELKAEAHGRVMELEDALHEYERITQRLAADVARALEGRSDG